MAKHGLVVQDGENVYFLRPEILEAAKVPHDLHSQVHGAAHTAAGHSAKVIGTLDPEAEGLSKTGNPKQMMKQPVTGDTIMCPW